MPWLIAIHCLNHRLELAAKDTFKNTYMSEVTDLLKDLYLVYQKSPKRLRELRALAEALEADIRKLEKAFGTRWSQHRSKAIETLMHGYETIVAHLEAQAASSYGSKADAGRFKNYLKKLTSFKFVLHLLFYHILLQPLSTLSCHLQGESVNLLFAISTLRSFYAQLEKLKAKGQEREDTQESQVPPTELSKLIKSLNTETNEAYYKGVKLSGRNKQQILRAFKSSYDEHIDRLIECMKDRLGDLEEFEIFGALKILDIQAWPKEEDALRAFGVQEMSAITEHFEPLLSMKEFDSDSLSLEWGAFKDFCTSNLSHLSQTAIWSALCAESGYAAKYPNLALIVQLLLVLPASNAIVERGFSAMRRIKTDWRCNLAAGTLDHLMRISLEGPPLSSFDPGKTVARFFSQPRKPGKRKHQDHDVGSDSD